MIQRHTKGPWRVVSRPEQTDSRRLTVDGVGSVVADVDWNNKSENTANARLIAAAPLLLEACQAMSESVPCSGDHCRHYGLAHGKSCDVEAIRMIRAAISAATL
jgi:hypothetical protein